MEKCQRCKIQASTGSAIVNGQYYANVCSACRLQLTTIQMPSSGHAEWSRRIDAEDHEGDIAQPWKNGKPNPLFVRLYPDKARHLFSEEEMRQHG